MSLCTKLCVKEESAWAQKTQKTLLLAQYMAEVEPFPFPYLSVLLWAQSWQWLCESLAVAEFYAWHYFVSLALPSH